MIVRLIAITSVAALVLAVAACSGDDNSDATPTPSVCDEKDALQQSVEDLTSLDVIASGTDGLTTAVDNVKTNLDNLKTTASDSVQPQVEALQTAIEDAQNTLSNINSDAKLSEKIADVETAFTGISTAAADLKRRPARRVPLSSDNAGCPEAVVDR